MAGGTAEDYRQHILQSIQQLSQLHSKVSGLSFDITYRKIVSNIKCCLTDRAPVNHLTVFLLEKDWNKSLIELNCNVHPLEAVSSRIKKELHACELNKFSDDCVAWHIIMAMNALRYSNKYRHVALIKDFFEEQRLPLSDVPRFLGHRLHVIFKLAGVYFSIFCNLKKYLSSLQPTNKVVKKLKMLVTNEAAVIELQVLGLVGKLFSGPWMKTFYTDLSATQDPVNTITVVKSVLQNLKNFEFCDFSQIEKDFFW